MRNGSAIKCQIINAYGPTSDRARADSSLVDSFYAELSAAINIPARWQLFVCGDFKSKLGKRSRANHDARLGACMGSYGVGKRNSNGDALVEFISTNGLFVTNTAFKHPCRHRTTWTGYIKTERLRQTPKPLLLSSTRLTLCCVRRMRNHSYWTLAHTAVQTSTPTTSQL